MNKLFYTLLGCCLCLSVQAQSPKVVGGAGFFRIGTAQFHRLGQVFDQLTPMTGLRNDFTLIGGEGYARLGKYVVGGGGYGLAQHAIGTKAYRAEPFCGGGYLYAGRIVLERRQFWLYPTAGVGLSAVGLHQQQAVNNVLHEATYLLPAAHVQFGLGADWLVLAAGDHDDYGGLLLGLRAGYQLSPATSSWQVSGDAVLSDRPRYALNGFFLTLTVGLGAFHRTYDHPNEDIIVY